MSIKNIQDLLEEITREISEGNARDELNGKTLNPSIIANLMKDVCNTTGRYYTKVVRSAEDLQNIRSDINYMVDGPVDMGSTSIIVPEGGISISGLNGARDTAILYSTADNYTMFVSPVGGYSGNVYSETMTMYVTGANSKLFDLDNQGNNGSFEVNTINFGGFGDISCTELGELTDYRQGFFDGCGFYNVNDGFTLSGDWSGLVLQNSNVLNSANAATLFKEGTDLVFSGSIRSNINFGVRPGSLHINSVLFDFTEDNIELTGGLSLNNVRTSVTNAIPNIPGSSVYARYNDCEGIVNIYKGGRWNLTTEVATTVSVLQTPYKLSGTTAYNDLQHFEAVGNNAIRYIGDQPIEIRADFSFSLSGTNGDQIKIYIFQWDNSASSLIEIDESGAVTMNASGRAENVNGFGYARLEKNDRIEFHVENYSAARNVTLLLDSSAAVSER